MCTSSLQYAGNNGSVTISTANPNLNGSGTMGTVLTAGQDGTIIQTIVIKAIGNTTLGMIRLFIDNGVAPMLFREIMVPANLQTPVVEAFSSTINPNLVLEPGYTLKASTENSESFNVTAIATDWTNCSC